MEATIEIRKTKAGKIKGTFSGYLTISNASLIHSALKDMVKGDEGIMIHLNYPDAIDLSFIQQLYAVKQWLGSQARELIITSSLSEEDMQLITRIGCRALASFDSRNENSVSA